MLCISTLVLFLLHLGSSSKPSKMVDTEQEFVSEVSTGDECSEESREGHESTGRTQQECDQGCSKGMLMSEKQFLCFIMVIFQF